MKTVDNKKEIYLYEYRFDEIDKFIEHYKTKKILLVAGNSIENFYEIKKYFLEDLKNKNIEVIRFKDFTANPDYKSAETAKEIFIDNNIDSVIAIGGGSAIDVAKCMIDILLREKEHIPFIVLPTTAGSGSEVTRYAVLYKNSEKLSITNEKFIPDKIIYYIDTLKTLPLYQKKSALMDALCHAVESYLSIYSNDESKDYSKEAIKIILENIDIYISENNKENEELKNCYKNMFFASNLSGKAINITRTTAGHAFAYKLTTLYNIAHGHAVLLSMKEIIKYMIDVVSDNNVKIDNEDIIIDKRGKEYIKNTFYDLSKIFNKNSLLKMRNVLSDIYNKMDFKTPIASDSDIELLSKSVNEERLKNNAIKIDNENIKKLYKNICK